MIKCPKCNKEVENNMSFCPYCGAKIDGEKVASNSKISLKSLFIVLFSIFAVVMLAGIFGNSIETLRNGTGSAYNMQVDIKYFFNTGWKDLETYSKYYTDVYPFFLVEFLLMSVFYFGGLAAIVVLLVFIIKNFVDALKHNKEINAKLLGGLAISPLPFLFMVAFRFSQYGSYKGSFVWVSFGWGTRLLAISSLVILLLIYVYKIMLLKAKNKSTVSPLILLGVATLAMAGFMIFGTGIVYSYANSGRIYQYNAGHDIRNIMQLTHSFPNEFTTALIGYCLSLFSGLMIIPSICLTFFNKKIPSFVCLGVSFATFIAGSIVTVVGYTKLINHNIYVSGFAIAGYVLGAIAIASLITSFIMQRKQKEA